MGKRSTNNVGTALGAVARVVPLATLAAGLALAATHAPAELSDMIGTCSDETRAVVGSPCWEPERPTTDANAELARAATLAGLTDGLVCVAEPEPGAAFPTSHVVVWDVDDHARTPRLVTVDEGWSAALAGQVWVELFCGAPTTA